MRIQVDNCEIRSEINQTDCWRIRFSVQFCFRFFFFCWKLSLLSLEESFFFIFYLQCGVASRNCFMKAPCIVAWLTYHHCVLVVSHCCLLSTSIFHVHVFRHLREIGSCRFPLIAFARIAFRNLPEIGFCRFSSIDFARIAFWN